MQPAEAASGLTTSMSDRDPAEDRADVRSVLAGDADAFAGIVRRWQGPLVNLAYRFARDTARAEEMAQEAFLRAFRFLHRWHEDAAFSTWLFTVAINVYRSELRRLGPPAMPLEGAPQARATGDPEGDLATEEIGEEVRRAVSCLPKKYRDTLILYYFHEMNTAETGRSLGVPDGTVKARLHRGRALLQRRLAGVLGRARDASLEVT